jgi:ABC-type polysaccharide/polyol phosphate export permease
MGRYSWSQHGQIFVQNSVWVDFGHNRSIPYCFQVQLVTCGHLSVLLCYIEVHFTDSSKMIGYFPEALSFNWSFLKASHVICW